MLAAIKRFLLCIVCIFGIFSGISGAAWATCTESQIDVDGTCVNGQFAVKTTNLSAGDTFTFTMSATGSFTVDCGTDGVLSSSANDVSGNTITRSNTTYATYTCTYTSGGVKTISFDGTATGYNSGSNWETDNCSAIAFQNNTKVASLYGVLSSIFPYLGTSNSQIPGFGLAFKGCTNLTSISEQLFSGYTTGRYHMFWRTFSECTGLTSLPSDLFSGMTTGGEHTFARTFYGCTGLTSLPSGLFSGITTGANYLFQETFFGCRGLQSIPSGFFSDITTVAQYIFEETFDSCSNLSGYIPPTTFAGLIANGSPMAYEMWHYTFSGTKLATSCSGDTTQYITGYEGTNEIYHTGWGNIVSCVETTPMAVTLNTTGATTSGSPSTVYVSYNTGWYSDSAGNNTITKITTLPTKTGKAFAGFYTSENGTGTQVIDKDGNFINNTFTINPTTLYAYFTDAYTVTYSCGTGIGTPPANNVAVFGSAFTPAQPTGCSKNGRVFGGWLVSGTTMHVVSDTFTWNYAENKTLTAQWFEPKFSITTTNLSAGDTFEFTMAAIGAFRVNWGDGYGETIIRTNTTMATYSHTYTTGGIKTILFGGTATGYYSDQGDTFSNSAIAFKDNTMVASLSGDLSAIFPYLGSSGSQYPEFKYTFAGCTNLTSIPGTLFNGYTVGGPSMFSHTFQGCTGLQSIPDGLFSGITTGASSMFGRTFHSCTGLQSIPDGLFSSITTGADSMFMYTFYGCSGLQSIPSDLFSGITTGANYMFAYTFSGCSNLSGYIPPTTFAGLIANGSPTANYMWQDTFYNTKLANSCDKYPGTTQYITGYEGYGDPYYYYTLFGDRVSCIETTPVAVTLDTTGATTSGSPSTVYLSYNTGWYSDSAGNNAITGITTLPTKTSKAFAGFYTGENGTGTQVIDTSGNFVPGVLDVTLDRLTSTLNPTTLYAHFGDGFTVTYSCGDGTGTPPANGTAVSDGGFTAADNTCSKSGYGFAGWEVSGTSDLVGGTFTWNYNGDKTLTAQWFEPKFSVTTTNLNANDTFQFTMSATGTFTVDCGAGGTLSSDANDISGNKITRSNTTAATYTCTYTSGGVKTISFDGAATGYNSTDSFSVQYSAITFASNTKVASLSGDLSAIFPQLGTSLAQSPRFRQTFSGCTNLTSIHGNLFSGYTTGVSYMFTYTFQGCTGLQTIPSGLFGNITGAYQMFNSTFQNCTSLQSIPSGLFSGVTGSGYAMFGSTFAGCTGLQTIPSDLFSGIQYVTQHMFSSTFSGCTGLQTIPSGLFSSITEVGGGGEFQYMFRDCTGLQTIPSGLFSSITRMDTNDYDTFLSTFSGCTGLQSIPEGLFSGITTARSGMFSGTFDGCTNLSGYIPPTTFAGLIANGSPSASGGMWQNTFNGTKLDISCSGNTVQYITGYEGNNASTTWNGKVSCIEPAPVTVQYNCGVGTGTPPANGTATYGSEFTPASGSVCSYGDYQFVGWKISGTDTVVNAPFTWNYLDNKTLVAKYNKPAFSITTTELSAGDTFQFTMSANGTFTVDCGTGGVLSGTGVSGNTITRTGTSYATYTCTYANDGGVKTISFDGRATGYYNSSSTGYYYAPIAFYNNTKVVSLSGDLSAIFPYMGSSYSQYPRFMYTFYGCTNLTSIPGTLFSEYTTGGVYMFSSTFYGCSGLQSIPSGLFSGITTGANYMFNNTFYGCSGLQSIPSDLFSGITTGAEGMFSQTFYGCSGLQSIPSGLFSGITTGANYMFQSTFSGCTGLQSIPSGLFSDITTGAYQMFYSTFSGCTGLQSIPDGLFSGITTGGDYMFQNTFYNCSNLSEYIPPTTFAGLIANGSPNANNMWYYTFNSTKLATSCSGNTTQYITGYEGNNSYTTWNGKVSCIETTPIAVTLDTTGATTSGSPSIVYVKYNTGWYSDSAGNNAITKITTLPTKTGKAFAGFYTGENATGVQIIDKNGNFVNNTFIAKPTTLYAYFGDGSVVTYSCGTGTGGTPPANGNAVKGAGFTTADNTCSKSGYGFAGWGVSGTNDVVIGTFTWNYNGDKTLTAQWFEPKFSVTTTNLNANDTFQFTMAASGTFTVDCGAGGVLSSSANDVSGNTITRSNTTYATYTCTYNTDGVKTISFDGRATGYYNNAINEYYYAPIAFKNNTKVVSLSGDLSAIFPYMGSSYSQYPRFMYTFSGCSNLTSIPGTLFSGYTTGANYMFYYTFSGCTGLQSIPSGLFSGITTGALQMFYYTFSGCTNLTSIPSGLFSGITTSASDMFFYTFYGCSGLQTIPSGLFSGITTGADGMFFGTFSHCTGLQSIPDGLFSGITTGATNLFSYTFQGCTGLQTIPSDLFSGITTSATNLFVGTFYGCSGLQSIPSGLFSGITTGGSYMFYYTFSGCTGLQSIPSGLFSGITTGGIYMFYETFHGCTGLQTIPSDLFSGITTGASEMFRDTFSGCSNLSGYIPPTTFAGLIANGSPTADYMWRNTFNDTNLATSCESLGKTQYITGYEGKWAGKVSCIETTPMAVTLNTTGATTSGSPSTVYLSYNTGWYSDSAGNNAITQITTLPTKTGKAFGGFYTGENGTGTKIIDQNGNFVSNRPNSTTLYALFADGYTVTYSCGTGTGTPPAGVEVFYGTEFTTADPTNCAKDGYMFTGWLFSDTLDVLEKTFVWNYNENKTLVAHWIQPDMPFVIKTINLPSNDATFQFTMSATGTFTVDCGEGGTLSSSTTNGTSISGNTITRTGTSSATYTCSYITGGVKTIKFGGTATGYNSNSSQYTSYSAIAFQNNTKIASIYGGLSAIFPQLGTSLDKTPRFMNTFEGCTGLQTIPSGLFSGITTGAQYMFSSTFYGCSGLQSIPSGLFSGITTGANYMFNNTFYGCSGLQSIPSDLFSGITSGANYMFQNTFYGCSGLSGYIPPTTFAGLIANGHPSTNYMWQNTFYDTNLATSCDGFPGTTQYITGYEGNDDRYYKKWNGKVSCTTAYNITYELDGGTNYVNAPSVYGEYAGATINGTPTKTGYTFDGWCTDSGLTACAATQTIATNATGDKTFYAKWTANTYNITYIMNDGTNYENAPETYTYATGATINGTPTRDGYIFAGWCTDSGLTTCDSTQTIGTDVTGDKTFYAKWTQCDACAATNASCELSVVNNTCTYTTSCNTGYENIQNNNAHNASCSPITYNITYVMDDGTNYVNAPTTYTYATGATINGTPTKTGYTFDGWCTDSTLETCAATQTIAADAMGDKTFYAKWTLAQSTVSYNCGTGASGTIPESSTATYGTSFTPSANTCTKTGYTFMGWGVSDTNDVLDAGTAFTWNYTGDKTLTAKWAKFAVKTTNLNANATFEFHMSATGTFTVDCGVDGTLSSSADDVSGNTITRSNTTYATYTCTYTSGGVKTITFDGTATGYNGSSAGKDYQDWRFAPLTFFNYKNSIYGGGSDKISAVFGDLSSLFPYLGSSSGQYPRFFHTFAHSTNLTSIPGTLFSGYTGAPYMFFSTFWGCTGLQSIPSDLFSNITTAASNMFSGTFQGCTGLQSIPSDLFSGITTGANYMFISTFSGCTGLQSIPAGLFSGITTSADYMFSGTFFGCSSLQSIPSGLFSGITTGGWRMFQNTFGNCSSLQTIPSGLFSGITTGATEMFYGTFQNCTGLQSIPSDLFSGVTTAGGGWMFAYTFNGCSNLSGYIPPSTFAGLIANGSPADAYTWFNTFTNTQLATSCDGFPGHTAQYITGYEGDDPTYGTLWNGKVSCADYAVTYSCGDGTGTPPATQGAAANAPFRTAANTCSRDGYTFAGWLVSDTQDTKTASSIFTYTYAGNKTMTAQWEEVVYNITYEMDSGTNYNNAPTTYNYGIGATIDGVPTKSGYTFAGWCTDSELTTCAMSQTISAADEGDKTFYAKWTQCDACATTNASCELSVVNNTCTYTTACDTGYTDIQNNGAYNASCSLASYSITYEMNGGTNYENALTTYTYATGGTIDGVPTKEHNEFLGWCTDSELQNCAMTQTIGADATGNMTFYAKWKEVIEFTQSNPTKVYDEAPLTCAGITNIYPDGATLKYGREQGTYNLNNAPRITDVADSTTIYYQISATGYDTVTGSFECSVTNAPMEIETPTKKLEYTGEAQSCENVSVVAPAYDYTLEFSETGEDGSWTNTAPTATNAGAKTVYYKATATNYETTTGSYLCTVNQLTVTPNTVTIMYPAMTATFTASCTSGGELSVQSRRTDIANVSIDEYGTGTATAADLGETVMRVTCGETENYAEVEEFYPVLVQKSPGVVTLSASSGSVNIPNTATVTVTENVSNGALSVSSGDVSIATVALNGTTLTITPLTTGSTTITVTSAETAYYTAATATYNLTVTNAYDVTYNCGSVAFGTAPVAGTAAYGESFTPAAATSCSNGDTNVTFNGWAVSGTETIVTDAFTWNYTDNKTLTAQWTVPSYNITYVMNNGNNFSGAPTTYEYGAGVTISGIPTRTDYMFAGWCTDSELQNCATTQVIAANAIGDKTFYAKWIEAQFVVQTTSISSGGKFQFNMSAAGTFTVNCGEGGILSGEGVTGNTISRIGDTSEATYTCTYSTGGEKTVTFSGRATAYNTAFGDKGDDNIAAIRFIAGTGSNGSVASVTGSLGSIFPTLGSANGQQPRFYQTFRGSALTSIPSNLFDGVTGYTESMFRETFDRCASLISIPSDLFANVSGGAAHMFRSIFNLCTSLEAMPENLFSTITTAADSIFKYSFFGDTSMSGYIPPSTFAGLVANNSPFVNKMWDNAFTGGNTLLTECPSGMQEYNLGYKDKSGWESKVSCTCGDNAYYDGSSCFTCPAGYDYNEDPGKTSINQCQIHCDAGTYLANAEDTVCTDVGVGYYAEAATLSYGQTGTRGECPLGRTTSGATAGTSAESCNIITVSCEGANYLDANLECVPCPAGYDDDITDGKTDISQCKIHCNAGTYIANSGDSSCSAVGIGYYSDAADIGYGDSEIYQACPDGSTTTGTNSTSISACLCAGATYLDNGVCTGCPTGYNYDTTAGKTSAGQCSIHCQGGTYIYHQYDSTCTNVGIGYWAGESTVAYGQVGSRNECDEGTTTETETSSSSAQCITPQVVCPGAQYLDVDGETCLDCPVGYTSNTTAGKTDITQCQVRCDAGTWSGNFTELPYLQSNSNNSNFIDTGYYISSENLEIDASVSPISDTATNVELGNIFGNQYDKKIGFSSSFKNGVFGLWHQATGTPKLASDVMSLRADTIYNIHYTINGTTRTLKVGDANTKTDERAKTTKTNDTTFKVFSNGGSVGVENGTIVVTNQDLLFKGRIYSLKLRDNGVLVLDLIPARNNTTMQLGMYNRVNGDFYTNSGTGVFTTGPATSNNFASIACSNVGNGYYVAENYTSYGSVGIRNQCPNGVATLNDNDEPIDNASSIRSCEGMNFITCERGYYLPMNSNECSICPANSYCAGDDYVFDDTSNQGIEQCPNNWLSPAGMWSSDQCGRALHIGNNVVYLRNVKKTTPSLNIDIDQDGTPDFFGNMTTQDVSMHTGTDRKLKLRYNNTTYSVYDDTVAVDE